MATDSVKAQSKCDKRRRLSSSSYSSTRYAMRGKWVCQFGFAAIVQLNPQTVRGISSVVSNQETFSIQKNEHYRGRKGKQSLQTVTALAFLQRYAALNALACPTGRGSEDESTVQWISSDVRRQAVHDLYRKE
ncbi:hypothetical protein BWQ96_01031 [Gracilariopsis chorda]|uniref:Uncharacterized protein n=1 Tax=Gracilariopsis chorda TaxID=448386 RepID=A0A2V3J544_9FLOR|nr:hypothetical protein BWQ96_01031 [Gracilariopsis chorda]|eukprot:PXF49242.1 hypothetical protein BWQ96_01031 [Gracilariopsis chorda]